MDLMSSTAPQALMVLTTEWVQPSAEMPAPKHLDWGTIVMFRDYEQRRAWLEIHERICRGAS